jgi:hypothetical protein
MAGSACGQTLGQASGPWILEKSGTTAGLRGIHAVGGGVAWASGTNGTVLRTEDGGYEWQSCAMPPGAEKLDFRGVWAWDDNTAIVMSSGTGDASRLYKTTDGCSSWKLLFTNPDKDGFWDGLNCADKENCMLVGDPVDGRLVVFSTDDGGARWDRDHDPGLSAADKEGAFAASNSSLGVNWVDGPALLGTGSMAGARILIECDACKGNKWTANSVSAFPKGQSAGIFSVDYRDWRRWVAVGGDYQKPNETAGTAAWSSDGGKTWTAAEKPPHGFRSAVEWDADLKAWIAAGTNGSDISWDDGKTWEPLDDGNWNALSLPWVVGPGGRIAKLDVGRVKR